MRFVLPAILLLAAPAMAQQQPDVADLQKALVALQNQRNMANDMLVNFEVRIGKLADENAKLKARAQELEDKYEPKKDAPKL